MSTYRNPNANRIRNQLDNMPLQFAGQTAIWRQYVSASAGNPAIGLGDSACYVESIITGVFGTPPAVLNLIQQQTNAGQQVIADFTVSTRERLTRHDELVWNGETYRVDGDPVPSPLNGSYISTLVRGRNT